MAYDSDGYMYVSDDARKNHSAWLSESGWCAENYNYKAISETAKVASNFNAVNSAFVNFCHSLRQLGLFKFQQTRI